MRPSWSRCEEEGRKRGERERERGRCQCRRTPVSLNPAPLLSLSLKSIQVTVLLAGDPANAEYLEIKAGLDEVIELTRDLVKEAPAPGGAGDGEATRNAAAQGPAPVAAPAPKRSRWEAVEEAAVPSAPPATGRLPPPPGPPGGAEADAAREQPWEAEAGAHGPADANDAYDDEPAYSALPAPKRGRVASAPAVVEEMPAWMVISEADDDKARAKKLKLQKSFKQKQRFAAMDVAAAAKATSWQAFASGKGAKVKPGFLSTTAKPSLFATGGVGARVGVVGRGSGEIGRAHV